MPHFPPDIMEQLYDPLMRPLEVAAIWTGLETREAAGPRGEIEIVRPGDPVTIFELDGLGPGAAFVIGCGSSGGTGSWDSQGASAEGRAPKG